MMYKHENINSFLSDLQQFPELDELLVGGLVMRIPSDEDAEAPYIPAAAAAV